jgi:hypothetical protein
MMAALDYPSLDDVALADLIAAGDPAARAEAWRRFSPVAVVIARRICRRIAHRMERCPGYDCDKAFVFALIELLDAFAGHDADGRRRARQALIVTWRWHRRRTASFADYAFGPAGEGLPGMLTNGLRAWNAARGLKVRLHPPTELGKRQPALYESMLASDRLDRAARLLGDRRPGTLLTWVEALFVDACESGLEDPIDVRRVARYLLGRDLRDDAVVQAVALIAEAVDDLLARQWPAWYDEYLSRPRQHTRIAVPLLPDGDLPGRHWRSE